MTAYTPYGDWVAYEPELVPPLELMKTEGVNTLEEWYRWAEEWSMFLRIYGGMAGDSKVLEIGCGLGRIAFPLRYILRAGGTYDGFEICRFKVDFLNDTFHRAHPNFRFSWANIYNTFYNSEGQIRGEDYRFAYVDQTFDIVYAASVFTHLLPETTQNYFQETFRVLKPNGRAVFSFFLLDYYRRNQPRPLGFNAEVFNFDYPYGSFGDDFAIAVADNPEYMTSYRLRLVKEYAALAGFDIVQPPIPGLWSGTQPHPIGAQDLVIFTKPADPSPVVA